MNLRERVIHDLMMNGPSTARVVAERLQHGVDSVSATLCVLARCERVRVVSQDPETRAITYGAVEEKPVEEVKPVETPVQPSPVPAEVQPVKVAVQLSAEDSVYLSRLRDRLIRAHAERDEQREALVEDLQEQKRVIELVQSTENTIIDAQKRLFAAREEQTRKEEMVIRARVSLHVAEGVCEILEKEIERLGGSAPAPVTPSPAPPVALSPEQVRARARSERARVAAKARWAKTVNP